MDLIALTSIAGLGYLFSQSERNPTVQTTGKLIEENERPNGKTVVNSDNRIQKTFTGELVLSTKKWLKSFNPDKTGVIGPTYKELQDNKYEKPVYKKSNQIVQRESDIRHSIPQGTASRPGNSMSAMNVSDNLMNIDQIESEGTKKMNTKRNRMLNPTFQSYEQSKSGDPVIYKTNYSTGRNITVHENGHNNMEPFFGSSIKQNMREDANKTLLESFTGSNPTYKHKKEVKNMFALQKTHDIQGLPTQMNREEERYTMGVSKLKDNVLPFEQKRVTPGLNLGYNENSQQTGFHDMYRPVGVGKYKSIDELRAKNNPKVSYKSRIVGEGFFNSKGQSRVAVPKNRPNDLIHSNFAPTDGQGKYKVRGMVQTAGTDKQRHLNKDGVVLRNTERNKYGHRLAEHVGPAGAEGTVSYVYDKDRWVPQTTKKDQTIDATHSHINAAGPSKRQTNPYDKARTTLKEQTHLEDYVGIASAAASGGGKQMDRTQYHNAVINGLKEQILPNRKPVQQGVKAGPDKTQFRNFESKKIQHNTYEHSRKITTNAFAPTGRVTFGEVTKQGSQYDDTGILNDRLDNYNVAQFKKNPYTQSLHSYQIGQNPKLKAH